MELPIWRLQRYRVLGPVQFIHFFYFIYLKMCLKLCKWFFKRFKIFVLKISFSQKMDLIFGRLL